MTRLRYVTTEEPGYRRHKRGRGFTYVDADGQTVRGPELRAWMESLAVPPAWTDVWISPYRNGHILATGRDDRGRKQYRYHPDWQETRNQKKFDQLVEFGQALPHLREVTDGHLRERTISRSRVLAAVVRLLESTLIRIGNEEYTRHNDSYGLTTLTDDHAQVSGSKVVFNFVGKSEKEHTIELRDRRLANIVKRCQDIPGYELFQYYDDNGKRQVIGSADVNAYLHEVTGSEFTAKVFRTWGGSTLAIHYLCEDCAEEDTEAAVRSCVAHVAELLGNTQTVCRKYYIHPTIMEAYTAGTLCEIYKTYQRKKRSLHGLVPEEQTLIHLIEEASS